MIRLRSLSFKGGIHPRGEKELTQNIPIEIMPAPSLVILPLQQHVGAPAKAMVQPGDHVKWVIK